MFYNIDGIINTANPYPFSSKFALVGVRMTNQM